MQNTFFSSPKKLRPSLFSMTLQALLLATSVAWAAPSPVGMIVVVKGDVTLMNSAHEAEKAKVGLQIFEGDKITSRASSSAKIVTTDRNVLVVGENSEVLIQKYSQDKAEQKQVDIQLTQGSLRSSLEQTYTGKDEHYRVETPMAVTGVRGTDFLNEYHPATKENIVCTFKGQVAYQAQSQGKSQGPESLVRAGNFIQHNEGRTPQVAPAKPAWVEKRLAAHEIKGDEQKMNVKPEPRQHEPKNESMKPGKGDGKIEGSVQKPNDSSDRQGQPQVQQGQQTQGKDQGQGQGQQKGAGSSGNQGQNQGQKPGPPPPPPPPPPRR